MFESARLKLTAWYLLIIMVISILFSLAFYSIATREIRRVIHMQESHKTFDNGVFSLQPTPNGYIVLPSIKELKDSDIRLELILMIINGAILFLAGGAGYLLAGITLRPIKTMVDEQNQFIADASHELRTPLTALRAEMEASLLDDYISAKNARTLIKSNLEEVISLQSLSDHLLALTTSSQNIAEEMLQGVQLEVLSQSVIEKISPLAKKKKITITSDVPPISILGEKTMLEELLIILLDNAVKYSKEKTTISLSAITESKKCIITISDQGVGIPEDKLPYIFDRFYQVNQSRTKHNTSSGYGLGLSIAKRIVESFHGTISIVSNPTIGTDVLVTFPLKETTN